MTQEIFFSETVQQMVAGRNVHVALGVWFDFASGEERMWLGRGTVTTADSAEWRGLGQLAAIEGLHGSPTMATDPITLTLSGVDLELLELTRSQASEIRNRKCGVYILSFDENFRPLDRPFLVELYLMDKASFSVDGENRQMRISVTAEPLFSTKNVARYAMMTDQDQQSKYPGDKIFERVQLLSGRQTIVWSSDT